MPDKIPVNPFSKIAMSLSGGGYRAASFHLGSMSFLNSIFYFGRRLLENVKILSTVSGGTITGIVYAQQKQENKSFEEIYHFLLGVLHEKDLVKLSIEKLKPDASMVNSWKRKNLINAFAELYDAHLTGGGKFSAFSNMRSHLEAVVFNSTEFTTANNFRFRNKDNRVFGNKSFVVPDAMAEEVKLADVMAASSCFPGGFEPILWPDDFFSEKSQMLASWKTKHLESVGLMDGGIYDNQGIQSILSYKKTPNDQPPYFDLVIISDVASPYMDAFKATGDKPKTGWRNLTLGKVKKKARTFSKKVTLYTCLTTAVILLAPLLWNYSLTFFTGVAFGVGISLIAALACYFIAVHKVKGLISSVLKFFTKKIPEFYRDKLSALPIDEISVRRAEPLILDRLNSLLTLLLSVFLKVVRRLNYNDLYENDRYAFRRVSNLIKELTEIDFSGKMTKIPSSYTEVSKIHGNYDQIVGSQIKDIAEEASSFGTTLWFEDDDKLNSKLDKLIATGQFTMCFNLLDYLEQLMFSENNGFKELPAQTQGELRNMYEFCYQQWVKFKKDPMFMVNELKFRS